MGSDKWRELRQGAKFGQRNREIEHRERWVRTGVGVISRNAEQHPEVGVYTHSSGQATSCYSGWDYIAGSDVVFGQNK